MLQPIERSADIASLVADRLRVNKLVLKIASWVPSAVARRVELWDDNLVIPPALAARAAVLAFGDELTDLKLPNDADSPWLSQGGRDMAAAHLLPRAVAALRQELQRWPTPSSELAKPELILKRHKRGFEICHCYALATNASARPSAAAAQTAASCSSRAAARAALPSCGCASLRPRLLALKAGARAAEGRQAAQRAAEKH